MVRFIVWWIEDVVDFCFVCLTFWILECSMYCEMDFGNVHCKVLMIYLFFLITMGNLEIWYWSSIWWNWDPSVGQSIYGYLFICLACWDVYVYYLWANRSCNSIWSESFSLFMLGLFLAHFSLSSWSKYESLTLGSASDIIEFVRR